MKNFYLFTFVLFISCGTQKQTDEPEVVLAKEIEPEYGLKQIEISQIPEGYSEFEFKKEVQINEFTEDQTAIGLTAQVSSPANEDNEAYQFLNGKLPTSYIQRDFFKGLSQSTYDLFNLPGHIIKKIDDNFYQFVTLVPVLKENSLLQNDVIDNGMLFKDYLRKNMSMNGSYVIGGFEASSENIVEVTLTDVIQATVPEGSIDTDQMRRYKEMIMKLDDSEDYFFIRNALLTIGSGRTYNEARFRKSINSIYLTAAGEVYKADENIKNERIVSVELTPIIEMVILPSN